MSDSEDNYHVVQNKPYDEVLEVQDGVSIMTERQTPRAPLHNPDSDLDRLAAGDTNETLLEYKIRKMQEYRSDNDFLPDSPLYSDLEDDEDNVIQYSVFPSSATNETVCPKADDGDEKTPNVQNTRDFWFRKKNVDLYLFSTKPSIKLEDRTPDGMHQWNDLLNMSIDDICSCVVSKKHLQLFSTPKGFNRISPKAKAAKLRKNSNFIKEGSRRSGLGGFIESTTDHHDNDTSLLPSSLLINHHNDHVYDSTNYGIDGFSTISRQRPSVPSNIFINSDQLMQQNQHYPPMTQQTRVRAQMSLDGSERNVELPLRPPIHANRVPYPLTTNMMENQNVNNNSSRYLTYLLDMHQHRQQLLLRILRSQRHRNGVPTPPSNISTQSNCNFNNLNRNNNNNNDIESFFENLDDTDRPDDDDPTLNHDVSRIIDQLESSESANKLNGKKSISGLMVDDNLLGKNDDLNKITTDRIDGNDDITMGNNDVMDSSEIMENNDIIMGNNEITMENNDIMEPSENLGNDEKMENADVVEQYGMLENEDMMNIPEIGDNDDIMESSDMMENSDIKDPLENMEITNDVMNFPETTGNDDLMDPNDLMGGNDEFGDNAMMKNVTQLDDEFSKLNIDDRQDNEDISNLNNDEFGFDSVKDSKDNFLDAPTQISRSNEDTQKMLADAISTMEPTNEPNIFDQSEDTNKPLDNLQSYDHQNEVINDDLLSSMKEIDDNGFEETEDITQDALESNIFDQAVNSENELQNNKMDEISNDEQITKQEADIPFDESNIKDVFDDVLHQSNVDVSVMNNEQSHSMSDDIFRDSVNVVGSPPPNATSDIDGPTIESNVVPERKSEGGRLSALLNVDEDIFADAKPSIPEETLIQQSTDDNKLEENNMFDKIDTAPIIERDSSNALGEDDDIFAEAKKSGSIKSDDSRRSDMSKINESDIILGRESRDAEFLEAVDKEKKFAIIAEPKKEKDRVESLMNLNIDTTDLFKNDVDLGVTLSHTFYEEQMRKQEETSEEDGLSENGSLHDQDNVEVTEEDGLPIQYDANMFSHLDVPDDIKNLFKYIEKYTPQTIELDYRLKPFIPDYIPCIGDIDAFLKIPRPDGKPDTLGLTVLDEPSSKQSDPTILQYQLRSNLDTKTPNSAIKRIENSSNLTRNIDNWIQSLQKIQKDKPVHSVTYSNAMPDVETLMQEWPADFEKHLKNIELPSGDLNCSTEEFTDMICALADIPIYDNRVESLHLLFTLYSGFKNSSHFQKQMKPSSSTNRNVDRMVFD
ncbi:hypothetical protein SNEBB_008036 [Seison nebaliae]|nr:hypothetical protein SNEBB_008036 [Seison nebaliae]